MTDRDKFGSDYRGSSVDEPDMTRSVSPRGERRRRFRALGTAQPVGPSREHIAELVRLERWLDTTIADVLRAAVAVEPACSITPRWMKVLAAWDVPPLAALEREATSGGGRLLRGAAPDEVSDVLDEITCGALTALRRLGCPPGAEGEAAYYRLQEIVSGARDRAMATYQSQIQPTAAALYDFAMTAEGTDVSPLPGSGRVTRCAGCGSSRPLEFHDRCAICRPR